MIRVRNTLAVLAFTALFGCAVESPASTPTIDQIDLQLHTTHATQPLTRNLTDSFVVERPEFNIDVKTQSYGTLLNQLDEEQIDYFVSGSVPSRDDIWAAPLARDGLVLIVHPTNPIQNLAVEEIRDIFSGQTTHWNHSDMENQPIVPLTYQDTDDIFHEFHRLVMGRQRITSNAQVVPNIQAMIEQVTRLPNAIGYIPFSQLDTSLNAIQVNGIQASRASLTDNIYPLRTTVFVIGRSEPPSVYRAFFSWVQNQIGQQIAAKQFIPLP